MKKAILFGVTCLSISHTALAADAGALGYCSGHFAAMSNLYYEHGMYFEGDKYDELSEAANGLCVEKRRIAGGTCAKTSKLGKKHMRNNIQGNRPDRVERILNTCISRLEEEL